MEEALAADDPRLISTFKGKTPSRSRVVVGFLLVVVGVLLLLSAMISQTPLIGIIAFAVSLSGAVLAVSNLGGLMGGRLSGSAGRGGPKPKGAKWSSRFEERWDRRNLGE